MTEEPLQDLSPWAHPKAQAWFRALFQRSQFGFLLEDAVNQPVEMLGRQQIRAILTFAVLLGKQNIWPEEDRTVLKLILEKAREMARATAQDQAAGAMSVRQHRSHNPSQCEYQEEIEILRRRLGSSFKTTKLTTPSTWDPFWT